MTSATVGAIDIVAWFVYLFSAVLFVVGLHFMNSPKTARKGNQISAFGMVVAVLMAFIVLFAKGFVNIVAVVVLVVGILIGAVAGVVSAKKVKMTDMPQLVSVFNTVGGGAAALVALNDILTKEGTPDIVVLITAGLGILIGSVTFTGSLIAAGKLQGIKWVKKLNLPGKGVWNILFAVLSVVSLVMLCVQPEQRLLWSILTTVFALCYGLVFVIPIGGADMPVVISVLNACTGTAVAMSGLAIDNVALIVAGALVGSAGVTLSILMAQAMNRPLLSVLAGGFGGGLINGSVKQSAVTNLNSVTGVNYVGGFIGHLGKSGTVAADNAQLGTDALNLLGATAGVLDIWGSHVGDSHVTGIPDGYTVTATHHGDDYGKATDKATGREVAGGFVGYADLARVKGCTSDNLKKVTSGEIAGGFVGETSRAYLVDTQVNSVLVDCSCKW